jgi:phospholipid/cholesterol/gamma-HCH transport system substrate-binding protein
MRKDTNKLVSLGIFVILGLVIFTIAVYIIGRQTNLFQSGFTLYAQFKNVSGLQAGNNVRYAGITVGSVAGIQIINDSTLQVNMNLDEQMRGVVRKNAIASIGSDGLVGSMIVNIVPGQGKSALVEEGDVLPSYNRAATDEMMSSLNNTSETLALLVTNLLEIAQKTNNGDGTLSLLLQDATTARDIGQAIHNFRLTSYELSRMGSQLRQMTAQVQAGQGLVGTLLNDTTVSAGFGDFYDQLDSLVFVRTAPIMNDLTITSAQLAEATTGLNLLLQQAQTQEGVVGTLLRDSLAAQDVREILQNLNVGSVRLNENMEALKHNFLFRGYFRKEARKLKKATQR